MTPGVFVAHVSDVLGVEIETVVVIHRKLHTCGSFTKGGRGLSAPHVTLQDAAVLLLAICANHCDMSIEEAVRFASSKTGDGNPDQLKSLSYALANRGLPFSYHRHNKGGLMASCSIQPWALQDIAEVLAPTHAAA